MYTDMHTIIKPAVSGKFEIKHFDITEKDIKNINPFSFGASEFRTLKPGKYVKLVSDKEVIMSDTNMEKETNMTFLEKSKGDVLIAGLGIGLILIPLFKNPKVKSITVIEKEKDVIDLVENQLNLEKVKIQQEDIFTYVPNKKYDTIYFDIWPTIGDNFYEMSELLEKFLPFLTNEGWINAWRYMDNVLSEFECANCNGNIECHYCNGDGYIEECYCDDPNCFGCEDEDCIECEGSGNCMECDGEGFDRYRADLESPIELSF